jgi:hypothetical protein
MAAAKDDWRRQGQEAYLEGSVLSRKKFTPRRPAGDHEHCEFCGAKFSLAPEDLGSGYATSDDYRWVCDGCFEDFREEFGWRVVPEPSAGRSVVVDDVTKEVLHAGTRGPGASALQVYVRLLNEGTTVYRPAAAEWVADGTVRLLVVEGTKEIEEEWEFSPGSWVKVGRRLLEGEQVWVAIEALDPASGEGTPT